MRLRNILIILLAQLISKVSLAQKQHDITGTWEGKFLSDVDLGQPKLVVEIYDFKDSLFSGVTHLYYKGQFYEHYKMIGWYDKKDSLLVFREAATIAVDLGTYGNCLGTYMMSLKKEADTLYQSGYWIPNIFGCSRKTIVWLKKYTPEKKMPAPVKKTPQKITVAPESKPISTPSLKNKTTTPVVADRPVEAPVKNIPAERIVPSVLPAKIAQRQTDLQSLLEITPTDKDSIKVDIYDNGEIDGDSVSLYQDETLRINKKLITAKPITIYISLDKKTAPIVHLRLVAESLGSIPPCTALMIVTTRSKRYEVHLSSNFNKNATVELFLKE